MVPEATVLDPNTRSLASRMFYDDANDAIVHAKTQVVDAVFFSLFLLVFLYFRLFEITGMLHYKPL